MFCIQRCEHGVHLSLTVPSTDGQNAKLLTQANGDLSMLRLSFSFAPPLLLNIKPISLLRVCIPQQINYSVYGTFFRFVKDKIQR